MFTLNNPVKTDDLRGYIVKSNPCPSCGDVLSTVVTSQQMYDYNQGALAQNVLPHLSLDAREQFISGYCKECWDSMFDGMDF